MREHLVAQADRGGHADQAHEGGGQPPGPGDRPQDQQGDRREVGKERLVAVVAGDINGEVLSGGDQLRVEQMERLIAVQARRQLGDAP